MNNPMTYKKLVNPKKIAMGTLKGGTGKTAISYNLSSYLGCYMKALLIDCDPQGNASRNCGIETFDEGSGYVNDIFKGEDPDPEDIVRHGLLKTDDSELQLESNFDLIPSSIYLDMADFELNKLAFTHELIDGMTVLHDYLESHADYFNQYDYIIFDTNPSMTFTNKNAFFAADEIILVCDPDVNSVSGIRAFKKLWEHALNSVGLTEIHNKIDGIILNKVSKTTNISRDFIEYIRKQPDLSDLVLDTLIYDREAFRQTTIEKNPVFNLSQKRNPSVIDASNALAELVQELDDRQLL